MRTSFPTHSCPKLPDVGSALKADFPPLSFSPVARTSHTQLPIALVTCSSSLTWLLTYIWLSCPSRTSSCQQLPGPSRQKSSLSAEASRDLYSPSSSNSMGIVLLSMNVSRGTPLAASHSRMFFFIVVILPLSVYFVFPPVFLNGKVGLNCY
jgi:hypothetical protein